MAARFYLTNAAPGYTPATKRGAWDTSSATLARRLGRVKEGTNTTAALADGTATTADLDFLLGRWISDPIERSGTLAGTVQLLQTFLESNAAQNAFTHVHAFVTAGDSDTVRGTLISDDIGPAEWPTTATGVSDTITLSSVAVQPGDRLVVEIGYRVAGAASATSYTGTIRYGGTAADLAAGTTGATTNSAWIEFSDTNSVLPVTAGDLVDTFATADANKWVYVADTTVSSGRLAVAAQDSYPALWGLIPRALTGSAAFAELVTPPTTPAITYWGFSADTTGSGQEITWRWDNGTLYAAYGSSSSSTAGTVTYNATSHRFLRIRESGGTTFWDTSPDGVSWTNLTSLADPVATAALYPFIGAGEGGGATSAVWDNFNVPGSVAAALAGATPSLTAALAGTQTQDGALACGTSPAAAALTGDVAAAGTLAGSTSPTSAALAGDVTDAGALAGTTSPPSGALAAGVTDSAALAGATSSTSGVVPAAVTDTGTLAGATSSMSGALTGVETQTAALAATVPMPVGTLTSSTVIDGPLAGVMSPASGALAAGVVDFGALAGTTSPAVGALAASVVDAGALAGATSPAVGALPGTVTDAGALAGTTSPAVGALTSSNETTGALAGTTSPTAGSLTAGVIDSGTSAGATSPAAGALTGTVTQTGALAGTTSPTSGTLTSSSITTGSLSGSTSPASGALAGISYLAVTLAGATSPPAGALAAGVQAAGAVGGTTPVLSGALAGVVRASGVLAGATPRPYAEINRAPVIAYPLRAGGVVDNTARYVGGAVVDNTARYVGGAVVDNRDLLLAGEVS